MILLRIHNASENQYRESKTSQDTWKPKCHWIVSINRTGRHQAISKREGDEQGQRSWQQTNKKAGGHPFMPMIEGEIEVNG